MKTKLLGWALLFLVMGAAIPLSAEQTEADQFNAIKAKAEKGDAEAQYDLGVYYGNGQGVAKDEIEAVNWYRKAAEQNYVEAQYNLGFCYYNGQGVAQDYAEAAKWYRKAAEQNLAAAQNNLGACYLLGRGVANDEVEAVTLIRKAAQQNYAQAQYNLGICYDKGKGVAKDEVEAVKWYRKAAEQNYSQAQFNLGVSYAKGDGVTEDKVEAAKWYHLAAGQNLAKAQYNLGLCYANGQGVAKDAAEAVNWFRKAAEQNHAKAEFSLSVRYAKGEGVAKDPVQAVIWCRKAAKQNDIEAQFNLGLCYATGQGVAKDGAEAVKWLLLAAGQGHELAKENLAAEERQLTQEQVAEGRNRASNFKPRIVPSAEGNSSSTSIAQMLPESSAIQTSARQSEVEREQLAGTRAKAEKGDAESQLELASVFYLGKFGVTEDNVEAVKWCRKAAEQGLAEAQYRLGIFYFKGEGLAKDGVVANEWFRKAAEQNYAAGQYMLGLAYAQGDDAPKDCVEAYKWILLAATNGDESAQQYVKHGYLVSGMSPEQIAEGQKLVRIFKPRKAPESGSSFSSNDIFDSNPSASGTGFFITDDGYLVSNYHVVKGATKVRLLTSAGLIDAKVVQVDAANDLALLKANAEGRMKNEEPFKPLPIAASRTVALGGTVATVGFPDIGLQGFAPKLAKGEIASLSGAADDPRYFQISLPVQPGNSGGALVDERGNVIGIVSAKLDAVMALAASGSLPENVNYAVKSSFLLSFLESVPAVSAKLKSPITADRKFEDVVKSAQDAAVLVLVY
jgi:TPR repeat protein